MAISPLTLRGVHFRHSSLPNGLHIRCTHLLEYLYACGVSYAACGVLYAACSVEPRHRRVHCVYGGRETSKIGVPESKRISVLLPSYPGLRTPLPYQHLFVFPHSDSTTINIQLSSSTAYCIVDDFQRTRFLTCKNLSCPLYVTCGVSYATCTHLLVYFTLVASRTLLGVPKLAMCGAPGSFDTACFIGVFGRVQTRSGLIFMRDQDSCEPHLSMPMPLPLPMPISPFEGLADLSGLTRADKG